MNPKQNDDFLDKFRRAYELWLRGEVAPLSSMLSPTVLYHLPGKHLGGGTLLGLAALTDRASVALAALDKPPHSVLLSVSGHGPFVFTVERFRAHHALITLDQLACAVWRFEGPSCVEIWTQFADQAACDEFWQTLPFVRDA